MAARNAFALRGYHSTKVDDIVAEANVSKGTFYLYFPDKRSIFEELVDDLFERLEQAIFRVEVAGDVEGQVRQNVRAIVGAFLADPVLTRICFSYAAGLDPEFVQKVRSFMESVRQILEQALRDGQDMGIVERGDPAILATFTLGGIKELVVEACLRAPLAQPEQEHIVEEVFRLLDQGYLRITRPPSG